MCKMIILRNWRQPLAAGREFIYSVRMFREHLPQASSASIFRGGRRISFDNMIFRGSSADIFRAHCFLWGFMI